MNVGTITASSESRALRDALTSTRPEYALRDAVRSILREGLLSRESLIEVLYDLLAEYQRQGREDLADVIADAVEVLEGNASSYAIRTYLGPLIA